LDDYMILNEQTFKIGIDKGILLVWIWNSCWFWIMMRRFGIAQKERFWKRRGCLDKQFWGKMWEELYELCSKKPQILFWYTTYSNCCFGFFFNKTWDFAISLIHVFNNIEKHRLLEWILCLYCCVNFFSIIICWNEF
jgi:hypothetical protein